MKKFFISIALASALIAILTAPIATLATNSASQEATTIVTTAVEIRAQDYTTSVTSITFPAAWPGSTVFNPHNNANNASPQSLGAASLPVVTLVNTNAAYGMHIYCNISDWDPKVVMEEYYLVNAKGTACLNESAISNAVTFGANMNTSANVRNSGTGDDAKKDLYLKVVLSDTGSLTGSSTISILSEPYSE